MKNLFVTSFDFRMFAGTGAVLVLSFLDFADDQTLLVCHEGLPGKSLFRHARLLEYELCESTLLRHWLGENRDIIPKHLGGQAEVCTCADPRSPFGPHRDRCHWFWFNKNASRWFRKVVALDHAMGLPGFDNVVWIDSDCVFLKPLHGETVDRWFRGSCVFYLKSPDRPVLESGVLGVRHTATGRSYVRAAVERYRSGAFREDPRWDDAYQFQKVLEAHPEIAGIDLATHATGPRPYGNVLAHSPLGPFILHRKGIHGGELGLMS